jgi:sphingomyelin phosphodiesterase 2
MRGAVERGHLVIGLGDFNMLPLSLAHRIITTHAPVQDIWRALHLDSSVGAAEDLVEQTRRRPIPTAEYNLIENGATCDSVLNTWRWSKAEQNRLGPGKPYVDVQGDAVDPKAKRLDYIFASSGTRDTEAGGWVIRDAKVGMTERHPTLQCSVSDHFSVECTLQYHGEAHRQTQATPTLTDKDAVSSGAFLQSPNNSWYGIQIPSLKENTFLPIGTYDEILEMIGKYTTRERKQRRYRLYHFVASVIISITCFVAVFWSPRNFVAFLLILLSTLGFGAGILDGLIGGLFVGSEIRALKEFEWEIRNARAAAGGDPNGKEDYETVQDW